MTESNNKALSLRSDATTVAVGTPEEETKKIKRTILDEEQYIEVRPFIVLYIFNVTLVRFEYVI